MNSESFDDKHCDITPLIFWNKTFFILCLYFFFVFSNIAFLYLYPLALKQMGTEHHIIGLVLGVFSVSAVISRPFLGKLVVLKGEFRVISVGFAMSLIASMGYILITSFGPAMLVVRVIHGFGFSAFIAAGFSLAAKTSLAGRRTEAFSIIGASLMGAIALAPYIGEVMIHKWGFSAIYIAASVSVFLSWVAAYVAFRPIRAPLHCKTEMSFNYLQILKNKPFIFLLISTLIFSHCQATVPNFIALISDERGVPTGRFFLISNITAIFLLLTTGKLIDRYGKLLFMKISFPMFALGILLIPEMIDSLFHPFPALLYGLGVAVLFSTHNAMAAGHGNRTEKPATMSIFTTVYDSGFVSGTMLSGWFAHMTSLDMLYGACGVLGFVGLLLVTILPFEEHQESVRK